MVQPELISQTTVLLQGLQRGEGNAADELFSVLYKRLREIAGFAMRDGRPSHTLQPTALVHEIWLRLVQQDGLEVESRQHFLRLAARAMRGVLVDHARRRHADKRQGQRQRVPLDEVLDAWKSEGIVDPVELDELIDRLRAQDERLADVIDLRFFAGLSEEEAAEALGLTRRQVQHAWKLARAWLQRELERDQRTSREDPA